MRMMTRIVRILVALLMMMTAVPSFAAGFVDAAQLDELFAELRTAPSPEAADALSRQIWTVWMTPDDEHLATRMQTAAAFMSMGDLTTSLDVLDQIVIDFPDYSEGWNQRATVEYMMDDFDASLADIEKTLALEPRHYGALSGRVLIYLKQGKHAEALQEMIAALAIHPYLSEKQLFPELAPPVTHA